MMVRFRAMYWSPQPSSKLVQLGYSVTFQIHEVRFVHSTFTGDGHPVGCLISAGKGRSCDVVSLSPHGVSAPVKEPRPLSRRSAARDNCYTPVPSPSRRLELKQETKTQMQLITRYLNVFSHGPLVGLSEQQMWCRLLDQFLKQSNIYYFHD